MSKKLWAWVLVGTFVMFNLLITVSLKTTQLDVVNTLNNDLKPAAKHQQELLAESCDLRRKTYANNRLYHQILEKLNSDLYAKTHDNDWEIRDNTEKGYLTTLKSTWAKFCGSIPPETKEYIYQ